MTKKQAVQQFRWDWSDFLKSNPSWRGDTIAKRCAFNDYVGHTCLAQASHQVRADLVVLHELVRVVLPAVPIRVPSADETQAIADWIRLLSHD